MYLLQDAYYIHAYKVLLIRQGSCLGLSLLFLLRSTSDMFLAQEAYFLDVCRLPAL